MLPGRSFDNPAVSREMTILDILSLYPETETLFREYDEKANVCLCCKALFDFLLIDAF